MAVRVSSILCSRGKPPNGARARLAELMQLDYARHLSESYIKKEKKIIPDQVLADRFGAPPVKRWHRGLKYKESDYVQTPYRPWDPQAKEANLATDNERRRMRLPVHELINPQYPPVRPIPNTDWVFFVGDRVEVLVGADRGKQGIISYISRAHNKVLVTGLHVKIEADKTKGKLMMDETYERKEQLLDVSKGEVLLVDPMTKKGEQVQWRKGTNSSGEQFVLRVSMATEAEIPTPASAYTTYQYQEAPIHFTEGPKDTTVEDTIAQTYKWDLDTFEGCLSRSLNLPDQPEYPNKTYWY